MLRWLKRGPKAGAARAPEEEEHDEAEDKSTADNNSRNEDLWFPSWPPPSPREIIADREAYRQRLRYRRYRAPKHVLEDSPLFGLYRLYEWIMADHVINIRNELEVFWYVPIPLLCRSV
jgi:hypothetical protein